MTSAAIFCGTVLVATTATLATAQTAINGTATSSVVQTVPVAQIGVAGGFVVGGPVNSVAGQPYSALQETQTIQTLADGTHITNGSQKVMTYRDSLGRTRVERTPPQMPGFLGEESKPPVFIEITDPVAGYRYSFSSNTHTAQRMTFGPVRATNGKVLATTPAPPPPPPGGATAVFANGPYASATSANGVNTQRPRPEISNEQLGTQTIEGVLATGTRTTTTYPVGFFGNDRPITTIRETWMSRDLGMAILTKTSDPRSGETTMKVTNISLAEPDPSLFRPPADYEIVDPKK